ncbi:integrase [uncultured Halopseudomonas sp.]|uniref:integrase n=1 Tax=uncultured Halopseudomonas sp. TaxID=2901193 RepID=UPI0030EB1B55|tara:strand:- start:2555 stop:3760 length:1206 start_codon:yes stop_codon:yes gene_type:complete
MKTIVPRPLFAEASSMVLQQEDYFLLQPSVCQYLNEFPLGLNAKRDFEWARFFLAQHTLSPGTYASYRGLVERLLLWSWISCGKSIFDLDRDDFEDFLSFNLSPPPDWIGDAVRRRFLKKEEAWVFNDYWRPFYARAYWPSDEITGSLDAASYKPSAGGLRTLLNICSSFYCFLYTKGVGNVNPVVSVRSKGIRIQRSYRLVARSLTSNQWNYVVGAAEKLAIKDLAGERALFILTAIYFMYLKATDLSSDEGALHTMGEFVLRNDEWRLELEHPRRPTARILVNPDFLPYLKRYRKSRGLSPLPLPGETSPLLQTIRGRPGLTNRQIRGIVKPIFRQAYQDMCKAGEPSSECAALLSACLNSIRDTGALAGSKAFSPQDLQRDLRNASVSYTYEKYYGCK